jgi:hypothetical protein
MRGSRRDFLTPKTTTWYNVDMNEIISVQHIRIYSDRSPRLYAFLLERQAMGVPYAAAFAALENLFEAKRDGVTLTEIRQVVREELDTALAGLQLAQLSGQEIDELETEVAAAALDGGAAWD